LQIAIEKGLISQEKAQTLDRKSVNSFIFHPGFSTADEVSDISGRGVGMDVVITNIKKIHGTVDVESDEGQGTQVRLLLPLTLAVIDALLIMDNNQKFAVPLESVKETVEIRESDLQSLKQKEAISLRGDIIGVSRLSNLLELERDSSTKDNVLSVVFLEVASKTIGVIVDDLANQQEIVVKPLQRFLANIPGISGSTILGNGEIILILDPAELIELASQ
jgi:two-component system chemotaxis sensor kinase CheA